MKKNHINLLRHLSSVFTWTIYEIIYVALFKDYPEILLFLYFLQIEKKILIILILHNLKTTWDLAGPSPGANIVYNLTISFLFENELFLKIYYIENWNYTLNIVKNSSPWTIKIMNI